MCLWRARARAHTHTHTHAHAHEHKHVAHTQTHARTHKHDGIFFSHIDGFRDIDRQKADRQTFARTPTDAISTESNAAYIYIYIYMKFDCNMHDMAIPASAKIAEFDLTCLTDQNIHMCRVYMRVYTHEFMTWPYLLVPKSLSLISPVSLIRIFPGFTSLQKIVRCVSV
jgi:hypothetical protein